MFFLNAPSRGYIWRMIWILPIKTFILSYCEVPFLKC